MPTRPKDQKRPGDLSGAAIMAAKIATDEIEEPTEIDGRINAASLPFTDAQAREIDNRIAMLDADPQNGRDAFEALEDFRRRIG